MKVAASILDADFLNLGQELRDVTKAGADYIHLDVMDGRFVPNISFGTQVADAVRREAALPVHTHLMVAHPEDRIPDFVRSSDLVTFHVEATDRHRDCIDAIHAAGRDAGISLNPDQPLDVLIPWLEHVEDVLVMSVFPGRGGQKFMPESLERIARLRAMIAERGLGTTISVDGGVKPDNSARVAAAGADTAIAGSAIFRSNDYAAVIAALKTPA